MEDKATKAFARKHGIKRERPHRSRKVVFPPATRRVEFTRVELRDLVWSKTMIRAAAGLGISELALRQLCKRLGIPLPTRGHFNRQDPKKRPPKPALMPLNGRKLPAKATRLQGSSLYLQAP
ncbi:hypothetical protein [Bradyrhizobium sp. S3.9.1]|uniref:hypothetical protein n=1 Tax=Bradyrhizobium sp. S3.9.1 TaxID=3156431 RepID=UPI0033930F96